MKLNLDKQYLYGGKRYGPGEVDVPDEAAKSIQERMNAEAAPPPALDSTATGQQHPADGVQAESEASTVAESAGSEKKPSKAKK